MSERCECLAPAETHIRRLTRRSAAHVTTWLRHRDLPTLRWKARCAWEVQPQKRSQTDEDMGQAHWRSASGLRGRRSLAWNERKLLKSIIGSDRFRSFVGKLLQDTTNGPMDGHRHIRLLDRWQRSPVRIGPSCSRRPCRKHHSGRSRYMPRRRADSLVDLEPRPLCRSPNCRYRFEYGRTDLSLQVLMRAQRRGAPRSSTWAVCPNAYTHCTRNLGSGFGSAGEICSSSELNSCMFLLACVHECIRMSPFVGPISVTTV